MSLNESPWFFVIKDDDKKLGAVYVAYGMEEEDLTQRVAAEQKKGRQITCFAVEVSKSTFDSQLKFLSDNGYTFSKQPLI